MFVRQLFDRQTWTYTYLLADLETREAALIDPVREQVDRDAALLRELDLELVYAIETHTHADHVTGAAALRVRLGCTTVTSRRSGASCADLHVDDGDVLALGRHEIEIRATPGHTAGCISLIVRDAGRTLAFTGDALFVRGCGRTDFQGGDPHELYRSVRERLFTLPLETIVYPGHDYRGHTESTVAEERAHNPRLNDGVDEKRFVRIMDELDLPHPRLMDVAVPANLACGREAHR